MATRVSPGVSVSILNNSFYAPPTASTVPVFFIATEANKMQTDGITLAEGTAESGVVRTVTSISQSLELYGLPKFRLDANENAMHGDCRNEYGLFALNNFLRVGGVAYVIRADVDLADLTETFYATGTPAVDVSTAAFAGTGTGTLSGITIPSINSRPDTYRIQLTSDSTYIVSSTRYGLLGSGTVDSVFVSPKINLTVNSGSTDFVVGDVFTFDTVYVATAGSNAGNGKVTNIASDINTVAESWTITLTSATTFTVIGSVSGATVNGTVGVAYDNNKINFLLSAGTTTFSSGDSFVIPVTQVTITNPLGATQSTKRLSITTAIQAAINMNVDIRSATYQYNLLAAPGYHECVDELVSLSGEMLNECFVVADTPCDKTAEQIAQWAQTSARVRSEFVAYYFGWGLASNLDGVDVVVPPSAIAMRTIAFSDLGAYVWDAPAGTTRGLVSGITSTGYITGTLGTATTYVECSLKQSQMDILYEFNKNINPITFIPNVGLVVWGQKTSASVASALDRINVVRLLAYLKRTIRLGALSFVFQANTSRTRAELKSMADNVLADIFAKQGLYEYATQCDDNNNTPTTIDKNELYIDIFVKPTKTAEFIYATINVVNTGDSLS